MLRIDQPSTIGMGIVAFVTTDSQSSSDHRQIRRSSLASGDRQTIAINTPVDGEGMTSAIRTISTTSQRPAFQASELRV